MKPGQLVPNWNDMVMPETTPMAKDSAKNLHPESGRPPSIAPPPVRFEAQLEEQEHPAKRDGDRRKQDVKRDVRTELNSGQKKRVHHGTFSFLRRGGRALFASRG